MENDLDVTYKLAYVARETRRLKDEIHALDVSSAVQAVLLNALETIERRATDLRRVNLSINH